jgi:hypothetical protein
VGLPMPVSSSSPFRPMASRCVRSPAVCSFPILSSLDAVLRAVLQPHVPHQLGPACSLVTAYPTPSGTSTFPFWSHLISPLLL